MRRRRFLQAIAGAVVAPALGVAVVLLILALRSCALPGSREAERSESGRLERPVVLELVGRGWTAGAALP